MSNHVTELQQQGYAVVVMNQSVEGTAYQKLDSKILSLVDEGKTRIAVVTNIDNPCMKDMVRIAERANRILPGVDVTVHSSDIVMRVQETAVLGDKL